MLIKVVKGRRSTTYPIEHYTVSEVSEECPAGRESLRPVGLLLELTLRGHAGAREIRLPEDGDVVYVMNDNGKTVDTHRPSVPNENEEAG